MSVYLHESTRDEVCEGVVGALWSVGGGGLL